MTAIDGATLAESVAETLEPHRGTRRQAEVAARVYGDERGVVTLVVVEQHLYSMGDLWNSVVVYYPWAES